MLPVLVASSKGEVRIGTVVDELAEQLRLSPEERSELLPSGKQTIFSNRVHWAKSYLSKAHLVEITRRGHFRITTRGQTVLQSSPKKVDNKFLTQFEEFRQFRERSSAASEPDGEMGSPALEDHKQTPDENMRLAYRQIETALIHDLLDRIREAPPDFFERLMVNLLLGMGYGGSTEDAGRTLGRSGDDGVDGVIDQDALGLDRVYIQAQALRGRQQYRAVAMSYYPHVSANVGVAAVGFGTSLAVDMGSKLIVEFGPDLLRLTFRCNS
jgi:restriction system protein